jgi:hypothetical protein
MFLQELTQQQLISSAGKVSFSIVSAVGEYIRTGSVMKVLRGL